MKISGSKTKAYISAILFYALILMANQNIFAQYVCQPSGTPIVQSGSLTTNDATQTGRVVRDGVPSSCRGKTQALQNSTAVVQDNYTYTAPVTGCAKLTFDGSQCGGATTQAVAYSFFNPATPNINVIGDFGFSTTGTASFGFPVTAGQNFTIVVHDILDAGTNVLCTNYSFRIEYNTSCQQPGFDRNNDGSADIAVRNPGTSGGIFQNITLNGSVVESRQFGVSDDIPVPADYDGDGLTDLAVYRNSNNTFYRATSQTNTATQFSGGVWGVAGDMFVPGDYDGDGKGDLAVWRPSNGFWYILQSSTNSLFAVQWGQNGDTPITGDFDGDLKTDFAVVRKNVDGAGTPLTWFILQSNFGYDFGIAARWGANGDIPLVGDFDGNGKADITIFRPSTGVWGSLLSNSSSVAGTTQKFATFGQNSDVPQPADYDGDGIVDYAVFRPGSTGEFYILKSSDSAVRGFRIGGQSSTPVSAPYPIRN